VKTDQYHVDGLSNPAGAEPGPFRRDRRSNLFGDIISDLGPATAGTIASLPRATSTPSAPAVDLRAGARLGADIAGRKIANPLAAIWSAR